MTSQPGLQTIAIHILPNISQSKDNQTMKLGQLIEYNKRNIFFENYAENEVGRLASSSEASGLQLSFDIFRQPSTCHTIKASCIKL